MDSHAAFTTCPKECARGRNIITESVGDISPMPFTAVAS